MEKQYYPFQYRVLFFITQIEPTDPTNNPTTEIEIDSHSKTP